ncbi:nucleotidyltransferase family protein [filamentous cyanobacterium CCP5]|nr:nucleotidyltransferase family protein [filamentous cyanobacterium CCP5]
MTTAAIILAAGRSTRMGRCKASLPWIEGHTLLSYQIAQWQQVGTWPIVVLGPHNAHQHLHLDGTQRVINPDPDQGKTHSLRLGLDVLPANCQLIAIAAIDQPRPAAIYQKLIAAHQSQPCALTIPVHGQKTGHPVLFSAELLPRLRQIREETQGLRQIVEELRCSEVQSDGRSPINRVAIASSQIHADLNTPAAYQTWLRRVSLDSGPNPPLEAPNSPGCRGPDC